MFVCIFVLDNKSKFFLFVHVYKGLLKPGHKTVITIISHPYRISNTRWLKNNYDDDDGFKVKFIS